MINGQSGAIAGQRPVDWLKVWLALGALVAPGITVGVIGMIILLMEGPGFFIMMAAFVLLLIGLVIGFNLLRQAQGMDDV